MAKKKKGSEKEFLYRLKAQYQGISEHTKWHECTWDAKEKIEKCSQALMNLSWYSRPAPHQTWFKLRPTKKKKANN